MTDRSEYAPINGARGGASSSPMVTALLVVIAVLSLVIIALCVILYQNDQNLRNDIKKVQPPAPFTNLDFTKDDLTNYYTTQHFPIVAGLVSQWTTYLQNFLQGKNPAASKMAVVFDIDETSLNNYPYYAPSSVSPQWGVDYGYVVSSWYGWVNSASAEAIAPVKTLYMTLQNLGVETIFITGRRDTQVPITETNLAAQGYTNYTTLITRTPQWYNATAEAYKSFFRQQLTTQGYNIIGCIGDQISDCNNGYAGYIMKIPNYIYYIE